MKKPKTVYCTYGIKRMNFLRHYVLKAVYVQTITVFEVYRTLQSLVLDPHKNH